MTGHLADALAGGLPVDVPRLIAEAQLAEQQAHTILAGPQLPRAVENMHCKYCARPRTVKHCVHQLCFSLVCAK